MIAAEGLSIGLGLGLGVRVVGRDLSLTVRPGEIVRLLGLIPALAGRVTPGGRALSTLRRAELAQAMAYVPQAHVPPFPYLAEEVVLMGRTARMRPLAAPSAADRPPRAPHWRGWGSAISQPRITRASRAGSGRW